MERGSRGKEPAVKLTSLNAHERRTVIRDTIGFWAPVLILLAKAAFLRRREQRASSGT